jgi:hypothetical protein
MARQTAYFPMKKQKEDLPVTIAAFDFETEGLGGKLLCATWYIDGMLEPKIILGDPDYIADEIIKIFENSGKNIRWYAHNAQYDWRYIIDKLVDKYENTIQFLMRSDNDVFVIKTHLFELVDSYAVFPQSLKKMSQSFDPEYGKLEIDDITKFDPLNIEHQEYAKRDAFTLVRSLKNYDKAIFQIFGVHIAYTVASTAVKAWRSTIKNNYFKPDRIDEFVRTAYFGGLVALSSNKTFENVFTYDINSSYPYTMREFGVPYGTYAQAFHVVPDYPGVYRVLVETPDDLVFPILPKRIKKGKSDYIVWAQGVFETCVTNIELDFAVKNGYKILKVYEGVIWKEIVYPFGDFVDLCERTRWKHKGTPFELVAKLMQNSVYGKFGSRTERTELFIPKNEQDYLGAFPWGSSEKLWIRDQHIESIQSLPQWAVFITAQARLNLLEKIYELGVENVIYCDTDSITTSKTMDPKYLGDAYGKFKLEKTWRTFRAIAPKVYVGELDSGKMLGAVKGIPKKKLTAADYIELMKQGNITADLSILPSFKSFMKGNRDTKLMQRKSTDIQNSQTWKLIGDNIAPITLKGDNT